MDGIPYTTERAINRRDSTVSANNAESVKTDSPVSGEAFVADWVCVSFDGDPSAILTVNSLGGGATLFKESFVAKGLYFFKFPGGARADVDAKLACAVTAAGVGVTTNLVMGYR